MAAFSGATLKKWRESQHMSASELAERISCDVTTIYRYENGKITPNEDVMYAICVELGNPDKWTEWMRSEFPMSYGAMHPETVEHDLPGALMGMYAELGSMSDIERDVLRDGADGTIDNPELKNRVQVGAVNLMRYLQRVKTLTARRENGCEQALLQHQGSSGYSLREPDNSQQNHAHV